MTSLISVRIDKWLWAVRIYRTRSSAADACRHGQVKIAGQSVKPSREARIGEVISANVGDICRTIKVLGLIERRVGAKIARQYAEDQTPPSEYAKARAPQFPPLFYRPKGLGRPTKKERRAFTKLNMPGQI